MPGSQVTLRQLPPNAVSVWVRFREGLGLEFGLKFGSGLGIGVINSLKVGLGLRLSLPVQVLAIEPAAVAVH